MNLIEMFLKRISNVAYSCMLYYCVGNCNREILVIRKAKINVPAFSIKLRNTEEERCCRRYGLLHGGKISIST